MDEMWRALCIILLALNGLRAATFSHELIEEKVTLVNYTASKKIDSALIELTDIGEEHRERNYGAITQKRKKIENAIATEQGDESSILPTEYTKSSHPFLVSEDGTSVDGSTPTADADDDRSSDVTTFVDVTADSDDLVTKGDVDEELSDDNAYDTTKPADEKHETHDLAEKLAFKQYRAQTNYIPRTVTEKYAQLLASYRFMTLSKSNDWTDLVESTNDYTTTTDTFERTTDLTGVEELIEPRRQKVLDYVAKETYKAFRKKINNMSAMELTTIAAAGATAVFGSLPPQCPKKTIKFKDSTLGSKLSVRKPRRRYNDYSAFGNSGMAFVDHKFYQSRFIKNSSFFEEHWTNITSSANKVVLHDSSETRKDKRSYIKKLRFQFPYFGHNITNVTVSTGGYIMTGVSGACWSTDAEGLKPFMTDFDNTFANDSELVVFDDLDKMTVLWQNMPLRGTDAKFTFAATLYDDGNIIFAYKDIPMTVAELKEMQYPVSIGIADSFLINKIAFYVRRKASHTYTRISFEEVGVESGWVLQLRARPACPQHTTCDDCTSHGSKYSNFKCVWCEKLQKCTSGSDFNRPLLSACHFLETCNQSLDPVAATPENFYFFKKWFYN